MADTFRQEYTPVSDEVKAKVLEIKKKAQELHDLLEEVTQSRETSLAKTKLEEAIMWVTKGLTQ